MRKFWKVKRERGPTSPSLTSISNHRQHHLHLHPTTTSSQSFLLSTWLTKRFARLTLSRRFRDGAKTTIIPVTDNPPTEPASIMLAPLDGQESMEYFRFGSQDLKEYPYPWKGDGRTGDPELSPWQKLWVHTLKNGRPTPVRRVVSKGVGKRTKESKRNPNPKMKLKSHALYKQMLLPLEKWQTFVTDVYGLFRLPYHMKRLQISEDTNISSTGSTIVTNTNVDSSAVETLPKPFRFLDLPTELRNQVYTLILRRHPALRIQIISQLKCLQKGCDSAFQLPLELSTTILHVNRQINTEASTILYGRGTIEFQRSLQPFNLKVLPVRPAAWSFIRNLVVHHIHPDPQMAHTADNWTNVITNKLFFPQLSCLQIAYLEFTLSSATATSPAEMVEPIYAAIESFLSALSHTICESEETSKLHDLKISEATYVSGYRRKLGWFPSDKGAAGTVCLGIVAGDVKVPAYFKVRPTDFKVEWTPFRGGAISWLKSKKDKEIPWQPKEDGEGDEAEEEG